MVRAFASDQGLAGEPSCEAAIAWTVERVYDTHADFVWRSLQRLGVRDADLLDVTQDVFVIVQRRLPDFRGDSALSTWLFGICLRLANRYRRRSWFRCERQLDGSHEAIDERTPETELHVRQRAALVQRALTHLNPEQRAIFVMFELETFSCDQIADMLGVPTGTVYSRLHHARKRFRKKLIALSVARTP